MRVIYRLFSVSALLAALVPVSEAQMQGVPPGHWQEGSVVGQAVWRGVIYVNNANWQWQPRMLQMSERYNAQAGFRIEKQGMVSESRPGQRFHILGGHIATLTTARPGLQPSVSLLQTDPDTPRLEARGELAKGQFRYGEITFSVHHVLAWQDSSAADSGWRLVSGDVTPDMALQVKRQLWQVRDYKWEPVYSGLSTRQDAFTVMSDSESQNMIAGAWVTALENIRVRFPGAEEPVIRWQGSLTPVIMYF